MTLKKTVFLFLFFTQLFIVVCSSNNKEYYENLLKLVSEETSMKNYAKAMEDLMQVRIYAVENKLYDMEITALNEIGKIYSDMLSYDKAIECYLQAYQIAMKINDKKSEIVVLNNIGKLYFLGNNMDKSEEYIEKAYKIAVEQKNNAVIMKLLHNLITISNKKRDFEQSEKYLNIAMERIEQFPDDLHMLYIKCVKADYLYLKKEYNEAEQLILEVLNQNVELHKELKADCLFLLSQIQYEKKNYSQAIFYGKEALNNCVNLPVTIERYEHLSTIYRTTNSPFSAWQYQDSVKILKDSLLKLNSMNQIMRGQVQFDLNNLEKTLAENKAKQKRNQLVSVSVVAVLIALFLLILYIRSVRSKQSKITAKFELEKEKNEKLLLAQEIKERETLALLERNMYKNEIESKNKQLISQTLLQLSKNELIEDIIEMLSAPNRTKNSELLPVIKKLQSQIKETAEANWNSFLGYFEQTNSAFLSTLKSKHPNLTANDIRLSSYIYLNLDSREIAELLHITSESYKKRKKFLAQKLGVNTPEIYRYLSGIV